MTIVHFLLGVLPIFCVILFCVWWVFIFLSRVHGLDLEPGMTINGCLELLPREKE